MTMGRQYGHLNTSGKDAVVEAQIKEVETSNQGVEEEGTRGHGTMHNRYMHNESEKQSSVARKVLYLRVCGGDGEPCEIAAPSTIRPTKHKYIRPCLGRPLNNSSPVHATGHEEPSRGDRIDASHGSVERQAHSWMPRHSCDKLSRGGPHVVLHGIRIAVDERGRSVATIDENWKWLFRSVKQSAVHVHQEEHKCVRGLRRRGRNASSVCIGGAHAAETGARTIAAFALTGFALHRGDCRSLFGRETGQHCDWELCRGPKKLRGRRFGGALTQPKQSVEVVSPRGGESCSGLRCGHCRHFGRRLWLWVVLRSDHKRA